MAAKAVARWCLLGLFLACGCGKTDTVNRQPISGVVSLDGQPLPSGTIEFAPQGAGMASGATISDGKFTIPADRGLPPGEYLVRISASDDTSEPVGLPGESNKIAKELIPAKYNSESTETFRVSDTEDNVLTLDMQSSAKRK